MYCTYLGGEDVLPLVPSSNPNLTLQVGHGGEGITGAAAALVPHGRHVVDALHVTPVPALRQHSHARLLLRGGRGRVGTGGVG